MTAEIEGFCQRVLTATLAIVIIAACGNAPSRPGLSPTAPFLGAPDVNAGVAAPAAAARADLGACLGGMAGMQCFNAGGMQIADVSPSLLTSEPINLIAAVNGSTVSLAWTQPVFQDAPVTSYVVEAGSTPNFTVPNLANFDTGHAVTALTASGVPPGIYYVRIRARNALGLSGVSNEIQVVVGGAGGGCPGAPRSLSALLTATGAVSFSWLAPSTGSAQSYIIQAGSSPGLSNLANFDTRSAVLTFVSSTVPAGSYYMRVRSQASGCPLSQASNEVLLVVPGAPAANPLVAFVLSYTCNPCTRDADNYALNIACTAGRCSIFRTPNPSLSPNTITATLRLEPGVQNIEVVVRNPGGPWNLSFGSGAPNTGGVVPNSFVIVYPPGGSTLSLGRCSVSGRVPEAFLTFTVMRGASGSVC